MKNKKIYWRYRAIAALILMLAATTAPGAGNPGNCRPDEIVCKMAPGFDIDIINSTYGTVIKNQQTETDCYLLMITRDQNPEQLAQEIAVRPDVDYCCANYYLTAPEPFQRSQAFTDEYNDGDIMTQQAVQTLDLEAAWTLSTGENVSIAVIDGGVNFYHPFLLADSLHILSGWDYIDNDEFAFDEAGGINSGHGTFVSGIIKLVAPQTTIVAYRVLDTAGIGDGYNIAEAVLMAVKDSCRIINLSIGMAGIHAALDEALRYASNNGVTLVAAAGNDSTDFNLTFPFPASREYCLAVAALDSQYIKADFSNYGLKIDVCAPGTSIYGPYLDSSYAWWDGTSFSTSFVSGLAGLIQSQYQGIIHTDIKDIIRESAIHVDTLNPLYTGLLGHGIIDPVAALRAVINYVVGDVNHDEETNLLDITYIVTYLYLAGASPVPAQSADINCDASINILDITYLINYLYKSGPAPCNN